MRHCHYTVTRAEVHRHTQQRLQRHLHLPDYSRKCTQPVLLSVVFAAAACLTVLVGGLQATDQGPL